MDAKEAAAIRAVSYIETGMVVGLGTGTTAAYAIRELGRRVQKEGLRVRGVPTSAQAHALAQMHSVPTIDLTEEIEIAIDGADEADAGGALIKGGGGALLREKLVAAVSRQFFCVIDESKRCESLGGFPLPVAVLPFGWQSTRDRLAAAGFAGTLRTVHDQPDQPFVTDDQLFIVDVTNPPLSDLCAAQAAINGVLGVVECGLFVGLTSRLITGYSDGRVEEEAFDRRL